jgi:hypothetical protein
MDGAYWKDHHELQRIGVGCNHWHVQISEDYESLPSFALLPFKLRVVQLKQRIEDRSPKPLWRKSSLRAWNEALKLAQIRNRVAHNPLMFYWRNPNGSGEPDFIGMPSVKTRGRLEEPLLSKASVDKVIDELAATVGNLESLRVEWCELRDSGVVPPVRTALSMRRALTRSVFRLASRVTRKLGS